MLAVGHFDHIGDEIFVTHAGDPFTAKWLANNRREAIDALEACASRVDYPNGGVVYALGLEQKSVWGVVSGQVRVLVATNEMAPVLGHIHAPGAWFGEVEALLSTAAYVQMEAVDSTSLVRVGIRDFRRAADAHPSLFESLARLATFNLWYATSAANDLVLRTPHKRIAAALLRLSGHRAATQGNPPIDCLRVSQQEIAALANVSRTTAMRALHEFAEKKFVRLEYGRITILDPQSLDRVLDSP